MNAMTEAMFAKCNPGKVLITAGAKLELRPSEIYESLLRHLTGDWGDLCDEDKRKNEINLDCDGFLLSRYSFESGTKVWIFTEWDRSITTILLPSEY
jgi:hypothetical protein